MSERKKNYAYSSNDAERDKLRRLAEHERRSMSEEINFLVENRIKELGLDFEPADISAS